MTERIYKKNIKNYFQNNKEKNKEKYKNVIEILWRYEKMINELKKILLNPSSFYYTTLPNVMTQTWKAEKTFC